jgi:hypothetical protein
MPTQTHRHGEAHAIQEARRGSLWRIAVAVGIEPEGGTASGRQAAQGAHCRVAITAEHQRESDRRSERTEQQWLVAGPVRTRFGFRRVATLGHPG